MIAGLSTGRSAVLRGLLGDTTSAMLIRRDPTHRSSAEDPQDERNLLSEDSSSDRRPDPNYLKYLRGLIPAKLLRSYSVRRSVRELREPSANGGEQIQFPTAECSVREPEIERCVSQPLWEGRETRPRAIQWGRIIRSFLRNTLPARV